MQKITYPSKTLAQGCKYTPSNLTDIQRTWRKFGWLPLAEISAQKPLKPTHSWGKETSERSSYVA